MKKSVLWRKHHNSILSPNPPAYRDVELQRNYVENIIVGKSPSNFAIRLEKYYRRKFGDTVSPIALLKSLAVISSGFKRNWKLWILNVAPSRHLKSLTTQEQAQIFSKDRLVEARSDFTIHSIHRKYEAGRKLNGKCLLINDMTLLLASKADRTRHRLIDALSELASEGIYEYSDFEKTLQIMARFSLVGNITWHSYLINKKDLLGNTFIERCLVVHHKLTEEEMTKGFLDRDRRNMLKPERFNAKVNEDDVKVSRHDMVRFSEYAKHWKNIGGYSSISQVGDMVKSVAVAYAILSGHRKITALEFRFLDVLAPYIGGSGESEGVKIPDDTMELLKKCDFQIVYKGDGER